MTLEDSGELAVGSFYAGVPHPPGYPVWTIYTWLFTRLIPVANIAYRVGLSSAVAAALCCGLLALMVSRGSSMILESIEDLKGIDRKFENALCMVSGFVSAMLLGYNGFMWSQAVIVEVYPFSLLSFIIMLCLLLRWLYAPHQRRYLYWAAFVFGVCITNHQTLLVAAMGIEILIIAGDPKLGRDVLIINVLAYITGCILYFNGGMASFHSEPGHMNMLWFIWNIVGLGSMVTLGVLCFKTGAIGINWLSVLIMGLLFALGAGFYFYMPIASMSNPPMNWGYARTVDGFFHALSRGQYEKTNPTNIFEDGGLFRLFMQIFNYFEGAWEEFTLPYLLLAIIPFCFIFKMQKRERAWMYGLVGIHLCMAFLLMILLNPSPDRQSRALTKVFFTASHVMVAIWLGYGITLVGGWIRMRYAECRGILATVGVILAGSAAYFFYNAVHKAFGDQFGFLAAIGHSLTYGQGALPIYATALVLGIMVVFLGLVLFFRTSIPAVILIPLFALMPFTSVFGHWSDNEQRGHLFGYWFGHDMFTPPFNDKAGKPIYPEMARDAVLFGGTDPGRFCPTYMIFCESLIPANKRTDPKFDRRDVYLITQNALADGTYLSYIRAHYNRSTQIDPPFFAEFVRTQHDRERNFTNLLSRLVSPFDTVFEGLGARIEEKRRAEGVYPRNEIHTPTPEDSQKAFSDYLEDAEKRYKVGQLRAGEDFRVDNGKVSVSGQVAVMAINGLLTKVIFDKNPTNEFYVEESFPLDWMYPYLSPFGVIMKINRNPLPEISPEMVEKDHEFWSQYSGRLIGNWITYDTPLKEVCDFAAKLYIRRDFSGFKGDRKFIRDDSGQKAFSKLRSSIGGLYAWRAMPQNAKTTGESQRMAREADFAFKQAFAYCPYSPEAVYRYVNLLVGTGRLDDAIQVVETCLIMDENNGSVRNLLLDLQKMKTGVPAAEMEHYFNQAASLIKDQKTNDAITLLDQMLNTSGLNPQMILRIAQTFSQLNSADHLESALVHLTQAAPDNPEAWYDLAAVQAMRGKNPGAVDALKRSISLSNQRLLKNPSAPNLISNAAVDPRFNNVKATPDFQALLKK
ncbi:MAG: hypothetical protein JWN25_1588 [Verrucomicrobiales bacterium]|nr:hypothetical protein [Verrucomicrobiales bacterium]